MTKKLKELVELVKTEANNLLKHATEKQLAKLDFETLRPYEMNECIYGQMTGYCYSIEANELIIKCAARVYNVAPNRGLNSNDIDRLNGQPYFLEPDERIGKYHSPIELFIYLMAKHSNPNYNANNKILIEYLQGDRDTLDFNFSAIRRAKVA